MKNRFDCGLKNVEKPENKDSQYYINPKSGEKGVPLSTAVVIKFKYPIELDSVTRDNIHLIGPKGQVPYSLGVVAGDGLSGITTVTLLPDTLEPNSEYRVRFGKGFKDTYGKKVVIIDNSSKFQTRK